VPGFTGRQGHHLGRPGVVHVLMRREGADIASVQIEGSAVIAFEASITLG
jgi:predicted PhzF superfamily epimerase YddE/YHI9